MGAISFAVGAEGCTYNHEGKDYRLTGWTLGAIADHERFLEQRAFDALSRLKMSPEQRASAVSSLAEDMACFAFAHGGEKFSKSLLTVGGLAHFFWCLARPNHNDLTLQECLKMVDSDPMGVQQAVNDADPRNRATAA